MHAWTWLDSMYLHRQRDASHCAHHSRSCRRDTHNRRQRQRAAAGAAAGVCAATGADQRRLLASLNLRERHLRSAMHRGGAGSFARALLGCAQLMAGCMMSNSEHAITIRGLKEPGDVHAHAQDTCLSIVETSLGAHGREWAVRRGGSW